MKAFIFRKFVSLEDCPSKLKNKTVAERNSDIIVCKIFHLMIVIYYCCLLEEIFRYLLSSCNLNTTFILFKLKEQNAFKKLLS